MHHAYALTGEKLAVLPELIHFLEKDLGVIAKNNPDFSFQEFETFTIDDGRSLQERHARRAISDKKIFIISTRFITTEAQNALLKMFEEPTENTHFFIIMPNTEILLPTLRSRLVIIDHTSRGQDTKSGSIKEMTALAKKFLSASTANRLLLVKNLIEEKDKGKAIDFVTALEYELAPQIKTDQNNQQTTAIANSLNEILTIKRYLHDRSPSIKLLLEHLCLSI